MNTETIMVYKKAMTQINDHKTNFSDCWCPTINLIVAEKLHQDAFDDQLD